MAHARPEYERWNESTPRVSYGVRGSIASTLIVEQSNIVIKLVLCSLCEQSDSEKPMANQSESYVGKMLEGG